MTSLFEKELEFIQLLCNPEYIRWLYNNKYFNNENFIDYLKYLLYFKDYKYAKFLLYPQCIPILEILTQNNVLEKLADERFYLELTNSQYFLWKHRK